MKMSKMQKLRGVLKQRLAAVAEEIFCLFEDAVAESEQQLCPQRKLLDTGLQPKAEEQEWSSTLDPPEPPGVKEEPEEFWTTQDLDPADRSDSNDDEEEKPELPQLHRRLTEEGLKTEAGDCDGPGPVRNPGLDGRLQAAPGDTFKDAWTNSDVQLLVLIKEEDPAEDQGEPLEPPSSRAPDKSEDDHEDMDPSPELGQNEDQGPAPDPQKPTVVQVGVKAPSCSICARSFSCRSTLAVHMKCHTKEKTLSCSVCGTTFSHSSALTQHMRRHSKEKPFSCSLCKATFKRRGDLSKHKRIHTGEKPFGCSVCHKSFTQWGHLKHHQRTHSGEKPFSCTVCHKTFAQSHQMKRHKCAGDKPPESSIHSSAAAASSSGSDL